MGTTGNQNFADYSYAAGIDKNYDYSFGGTGNETLVLGSAQTGYSNANAYGKRLNKLMLVLI